MRLFIEFWVGLNPWVRFGTSIGLILISTALYFADRFWPWGWCVGGVLLMFSFPNDAQKRGYHDF